MPWPGLWLSSDNKKAEKDTSIVEEVQNISSELVSAIDEKTSNIHVHSPSTTSTILQAFTEPRTLVATAILTTACLGLLRLYRTHLRHIPEARNIHQSYFRKRSIFGKVTSVGDGDNFRLYHTPGGVLSGWGWLPGRNVPSDKKLLKDNTIHVRIAGIDAPELAHFGRPSQPFSKEALDWLTTYILGRRVRAHVYKLDQYSRVVATVHVRKGIFRRDVGLQMIRAGFATVYEAKTGAEFAEGSEEQYKKEETRAKRKRRGMWAGNPADFESPRQYKTRHNEKTGSDSAS